MADAAARHYTFIRTIVLFIFNPASRVLAKRVKRHASKGNENLLRCLFFIFFNMAQIWGVAR